MPSRSLSRPSAPGLPATSLPVMRWQDPSGQAGWMDTWNVEVFLDNHRLLPSPTCDRGPRAPVKVRIVHPPDSLRSKRQCDREIAFHADHFIEILLPSFQRPGQAGCILTINQTLVPDAVVATNRSPSLTSACTCSVLSTCFFGSRRVYTNSTRAVPAGVTTVTT